MAGLNRLRVLILLTLIVPAASSISVPPANAPLLTYNQNVLPNEWLEIGSHFNLTGDDLSRNYTLPFLFNFYGNNYTRIFISTNGLITFDRADNNFAGCSDPANPACLPSKIAVTPVWTDFRTDLRSDTDVFTGMPDADHVLVRWKVTPYSLSDRLVNFEAILGRDSTIRFNYGPSNATLTATEGISKGDRTDYFVNPITSSNNASSYFYTPIFGFRPLVKYNTSPSLPWVVGEPIQFNATETSSANGPVVLYRWNFGDGTNNTAAVAEHMYAAPGTYVVSIFVKDSIGASNSTSFPADVGIADARLTDLWSDRRHVNLASGGNVTLSSRVINIQALPLSTKILFQAINHRNGTAYTVPSQIVLLNTREDTTLSANFPLATATGRWSIFATLYYTPRDPSGPDPRWITGETSYLWILVIS